MLSLIISLFSLGILLIIAWNTSVVAQAIEIMVHRQELMRKAIESMQEKNNKE